MKILVTGAAGYLGSVLSLTLVAKGHEVTGFDNLVYGGDALLPLIGHERFRLIAADLRDPDAVAGALAGIDAVVHLAAVVGDPACARHPEIAREINEWASLALIEAARNAGVARLVFASTCSNYGRMADTSVLADETHPLHPLSLYAAAKVAVEEQLFRSRTPMAVTVLRFATLYGMSPRMRFDLTVNQFVMEMLVRRKVTVFGEQFWRPYVHVRDAASAIECVLQAPAAQVSGQLFNVGDTRENYRKRDLIDIISRRVPGAAVDYVHVAEDPRDYKVSFERIRRTLGFAPARTVDDGVVEIAGALAAGVVADVDAESHYNDRTSADAWQASRRDRTVCAQ